MLDRRNFLVTPAVLGALTMMHQKAAASVDLDGASGKYRVIPGETIAAFNVPQVGGRGIQGRFSQLEGVLDIDAQNLSRSKIDVSIQTQSVSTGDPGIDDFLKGSSMFDVARHPQATFSSRAVRRTNKTMADIEGRLAIKGISQRVNLSVELEDLAPSGRAVFLAKSRFFRSLYDMDAGLPLYKNTVSLSIRAVCQRLS